MHYDSRYYNKDNLFAYDEILNFAISERGLGKTTCAKFWCIDDFLKHGNRFVWVRRYGTEIYGDKHKGIEGCAKDFFKKVQQFYPKVKFLVKGGHCYINDKDAGQFVALSTSSALKGVDFPDVNKIVFDEFIITEGSKYTYLTNEVGLLLDLYSTVIRPITDENGNEERTGKMWLLANAITFANDYFYFFDIKPFKSRFYHDKRRGIVVEQCKNEKYREAVRKTKFGKLIRGTAYESYAIDNEYMLDNNDFIMRKSAFADFIFNVRYMGQEWGIYADGQYVYVTNKVDKTRMFFTFQKADHSLDSTLIKNARGTRFDILVRNYQLGLVRFDSIMIKKKFLDFIKIFIVR